MIRVSLNPVKIAFVSIDGAPYAHKTRYNKKNLGGGPTKSCHSGAREKAGDVVLQRNQAIVFYKISTLPIERVL